MPLLKLGLASMAHGTAALAAPSNRLGCHIKVGGSRHMCHKLARE